MASNKRHGSTGNFRAAFEAMPEAAFITGPGCEIEYVNTAFTELLGWGLTDLAGTKASSLGGDGGWGEVLSPPGFSGVVNGKRKDGSAFTAFLRFIALKDGGGEVTGYAGFLVERPGEDGTDQLTGIHGRGAFIDLLEAWLESPKKAPVAALLIIDIDQFKFINDTHGQGMGDEFLRGLAALLKTLSRYVSAKHLKTGREEPILSRLSGDEFAILFPSSGRIEAAFIAEEIKKGIEGFFHPGLPWHATASIGVALYPEHGQGSSVLLSKADAAMHQAKELGRNRFHFFSPEERAIERMHSRLRLKEDIIGALKDGRFEAWFQPIVYAADRSVHHYEALARMRGRTGSIVLPGPFIDLAERFGLMGGISRVVVGRAMALIAGSAGRKTPPTLSVNLSGREIADREFLYFIRSSFNDTGAAPDRLIFEIKDTSAIVNLDGALKFIRSVKELGCKVCVDGFGAGFSSFLYLKELQADYLKISGHFVRNIDKNLSDRLFVKALAETAAKMGLKTIAEFVEEEGQLAALRELGVDYAQGYLFGKPSPTLF